MIRLINLLFVLSLYFPVEAQIGLEFTLKGGIRTEGNHRFLPYESGAVSDNTWYTYGGSIYIPKIKVAAEWTLRESGRYAFLKIPNFLITKPKQFRPPVNFGKVKTGDTLYTNIEFYPNWFSISYNLLPKNLIKHQFFIGAGLVKRKGGLQLVDYTVQQGWGLEFFIKYDPVVSQNSILWKTEYIFKPFKYTLISTRFNYAYFSKFPHGYYEFIVSIGTYIDL